MSEAQAWLHSDTEDSESPDRVAAYRFFRSRQGTFIKYTDEQSFAEEQVLKEQSNHKGLGPLPFKNPESTLGPLPFKPMKRR